MNARMHDRVRTGFTLVELTIALVIMGIVVSTAVAFVAQQNSAYQAALDRMVALRNIRYALSTLGQDLETLGTNVPAGQPNLFYADDDVVVFAADHTTNVDNDPFAVYYAPGAPTGEVVAPSGTFPLPNASANYPDTAYLTGTGTRSPAEVLTFWFEADTSSARNDDYMLYRQVNSTAGQVVARNILRKGSEPFFRFHRLTAGGDLLAVVEDSLLPVRHRSISGDSLDVLADSIRAVRVNLGSTDGQSGDNENTMELSRLVGFPNAVLEALNTCGDTPIHGSGLSASLATLSTGDVGAELSWSPAVDENAGEADVVRYVIWRREVGSGDWGEPYRAIPAGEASYTLEDADVAADTSYEYALAAQDCTPALSSLTTAGPVVVPPSP